MPRRQPKARDIFGSLNCDVPSYTLVVQGRFHAFALAKALLASDMPVQVLTNYPAFMAERFGVPAKNIVGFGSLGLLHRYAHRWNLAQKNEIVNRFLHQTFSRWAGREVVRNPADVLHAFSGIATELYQTVERAGQSPLRLLARGSAHIRDQYRDLNRESKRANSEIELPSPWMMRREMNEYRDSDNIVTLSSYAQKSFISRGYSDEKVVVLPLGSNVKQFRPEREVLDRRIERVRSGKKLTVLYTGNVSLQKGIIDLIEAARALAGQMHFRVVGTIISDALERANAARDVIEFVPRVPEHELPGIYADADVFLFPTLHDGYAAVLAQARAGCLPIVATDHCAAPDMIVNGDTGWIVPPRRADLIIERLRALDLDRETAIGVMEKLWESRDSRDWSDVAKDFMILAARALKLRQMGSGNRPELLP